MWIERVENRVKKWLPPKGNCQTCHHPFTFFFSIFLSLLVFGVIIIIGGLSRHCFFSQFWSSCNIHTLEPFKSCSWNEGAFRAKKSIELGIVLFWLRPPETVREIHLKGVLHFPFLCHSFAGPAPLFPFIDIVILLLTSSTMAHVLI